MKPEWLILPAVILSFLYLFTPLVLWITDRVFRKPLGQKLFAVTWNSRGILISVVLWVAYLWMHFRQ